MRRWCSRRESSLVRGHRTTSSFGPCGALSSRGEPSMAARARIGDLSTVQVAGTYAWPQCFWHLGRWIPAPTTRQWARHKLAWWGTSLVALAGRTRGPVRHSCARPDRRALRADAGEREPGPSFHGSRYGERRCRSSDQTRRLYHFVAMGPLPKKCWGGDLAPSRSGNLPSRARHGAVADRNPGAVEDDGSGALRGGLPSTPATECRCAVVKQRLASFVHSERLVYRAPVCSCTHATHAVTRVSSLNPSRRRF